VLIVGSTGQGKSTTLASILQQRSRSVTEHIITIEDPIEYIMEPGKSVIQQREVHRDVMSFSDGIRAALREDPDVMMVGEMRDLETIETAMHAAETGHLVFGTLHTNSAPSTINRIIDVFSGDEQGQIRAMILTSLVAVISQVLLPKYGGGRVAAPEIMITNHAIANLIREDKVHQLYSQMQLGQGSSGMQTQTQVLEQLVKNGLVTKEVAMQFANKPDELKTKINFR